MMETDSRSRPAYALLTCFTLALSGPLILAGCEAGEPIAEQTDERFPSDVDGDDLPALVVTGLAGLPAAHVVSPWLVSSRMFRELSHPDLPGDGVVDLVEYDGEYPVSVHVDHYTERLDSCVLRQDSGSEGTGMARNSSTDNPPPPRISGGATVVVNAPSGPWFSYTRSRKTGNAGEESFYVAVDQLPGALPAQATLSIPGDAFPGVSAHPLYEPEPVQRLQPESGRAVDVSSRYRWIPLEQGSHVKIDLLAFDEMGEFKGFPVSCWVVDDGVFAMPRDVLATIDSSEQTLRVRYSRVYSRLDVVNGIVILQISELAE